jgi:hypothetical protein
MLKTEQIEELLALVTSLDRASLCQLIQEYRASFPLDFTNEFLETVELDRLRHIFVAVCLQCQRMPEIMSEIAA